LAFTRNPFLLVVMVARNNIKHRRIHKEFRVFPESFAPPSSGFACSRTRTAIISVGGIRWFPVHAKKYHKITWDELSAYFEE
jgi:hypothetical protein